MGALQKLFTAHGADYLQLVALAEDDSRKALSVQNPPIVGHGDELEVQPH